MKSTMNQPMQEKAQCHRYLHLRIKPETLSTSMWRDLSRPTKYSKSTSPKCFFRGITCYKFQTIRHINSEPTPSVHYKWDKFYPPQKIEHRDTCISVETCNYGENLP